jgi:transcriptional regulator with XRE-family HTH domain
MVIDIKKILRLARDKGLTDQQICKISNKHKCTLWRWEQGKTKPHPRTLAKLIKAINA